MMELPLSKPHCSGTLLLLLVSTSLLLEKASSIPSCLVEQGGCWNPVVETFNSAMQKAETLRTLVDQLYVELYHNKFSSGHFLTLSSQMIRRDEIVVRAGTYCHSTLSKPPETGAEHAGAETEKYLKTLINFITAWINPLYHLVTELSAMQDVPETILSKAIKIEENKRELLDDLRWILTKVYPTAEIKEAVPSWEHLSFLKSNGKIYKFLAIFNLSKCIYNETYYILFYLRTLKCHITGKDC